MCSCVHTDDKTAKIAASASDGQFWISRVLTTIEELEKDTKHVTALSEIDEEELVLQQKARELIERLHEVREHPHSLAGSCAHTVGVGIG